MTTITASPQANPRLGNGSRLTVALLVGLIVGSTVTTLVAQREDAPGAAGAQATVATTDAGTQYAAWYLRASGARPASTGAGHQYRDWYTRSSSLAGSTSAGEQYRDWFTPERHAR